MNGAHEGCNFLGRFYSFDSGLNAGTHIDSPGTQHPDYVSDVLRRQSARHDHSLELNKLAGELALLKRAPVVLLSCAAGAGGRVCLQQNGLDAGVAPRDRIGG